MTPEPDPAEERSKGNRDFGPEITIEILGAGHEPFAAQPTLRFELSVFEPTDRPIYAIALKAQIMFDPARRDYDAPDAGEALRDLRRARALAVDDPQLPVVSLDPGGGQLVHGRHDVRPRGAVHV